MSAAIALRYEDDDANPVATVTGLHVEATGLTINETQTSQHIIDGVYADPITYYLSAEHATEDDLISPRFQGADFTWDDLVLPASGSWTFYVRKDSDDSDVVSTSKTADAP